MVFCSELKENKTRVCICAQICKPFFSQDAALTFSQHYALWALVSWIFSCCFFCVSSATLLRLHHAGLMLPMSQEFYLAQGVSGCSGCCKLFIASQTKPISSCSCVWPCSFSQFHLSDPLLHLVWLVSCRQTGFVSGARSSEDLNKSVRLHPFCMSYP